MVSMVSFMVSWISLLIQLKNNNNIFHFSVFLCSWNNNDISVGAKRLLNKTPDWMLITSLLEISSFTKKKNKIHELQWKSDAVLFFNYEKKIIYMNDNLKFHKISSRNTRNTHSLLFKSVKYYTYNYQKKSY